jgi:hypothetical protein
LLPLLAIVAPRCRGLADLVRLLPPEVEEKRKNVYTFFKEY